MLKTALKNKTFKVDPKKLAKAEKLVDVPELVRNAIDKVIDEEVCPCCRQIIQKKK